MNAVDRLLAILAAWQNPLKQAERIQTQAARRGFDWPEVAQVFEKVEEELAELRDAYAQGDGDHLQEELGDLLFAAVNLARHLKVDPEAALRASCRKFTRRLDYLKARLKAQGKTLAGTPLAELDALWDEAKRREA